MFFLLDGPVFVEIRLALTGYQQIVEVLVKLIKMKYAADLGLMLFILRFVKLSFLCFSKGNKQLKLEIREINP